MTTLVVLFNLKDDSAQHEYEDWARNTDLATVRKLGSVNDFRVLKSAGLFGSGDPAPYQYIEVLELTSVDGLLADVGSDTMRQVAAEFREFADNPTFIVTESID